MHVGCRGKPGIESSWAFEDRCWCFLLLAHLWGFGRSFGGFGCTIRFDLSFGPFRVTCAAFPVESSPMVEHGLGSFGILGVGNLLTPSNFSCVHCITGRTSAGDATASGGGNSTTGGRFNGSQVSRRASLCSCCRGCDRFTALRTTRRAERWHRSWWRNFRSSPRGYTGASTTSSTTTSTPRGPHWNR